MTPEGITPYHAKYFAYELTRRCGSGTIQRIASSLSDAQVDLNPHQIEAALFAFRSPLSKGALLADEVGLGKTIEAGIVIAQKWAERRRKILIIVPSNLRVQWYQELLDKFFLPATILETGSYNEAITKGNLNPFEREDIVICSYHFARFKEACISRVEWDLVVIDEAHRLRNVYKPGNKIANSIKMSLAQAPKILLTATPLQNTLLELYGLISIIDDYIFGDLKSFKALYTNRGVDDNFDDLKERLKPACIRTLRRQVREYISYTNRYPITQEFTPSADEQKLYNLVSGYLQRERLYALPASQRQLMTLILRKLLASSTFAIAGTLKALADRLEALLAGRPMEEPLDGAIGEAMENVQQLKEEWASEEGEPQAEGESNAPLSGEDFERIKAELNDLREFQRLAESIQRNSKGDVLLKALRAGFKETARPGGNHKAIIFTESTRTQQYLKRLLEQTEYKGKVVLFNGSNTDMETRAVYERWLQKRQGTDRVTGSRSADTRAALVEHFRDEAVIMIATEAGAEGINLQFCSLVVNYDLPWNPQRIEQRIGRCHRYGQKFDVVVVNFLNKKNEADQRVYRLLDEKFRLFSGVFGASDEILGILESGVDFEKRIARIYQECRTQDEIQAAFDRLQQEMEEQIADRLRGTRETLLESFDEEVHEKLRVNLKESTEYLGRYEQWLWAITRYFLEDHATFDLGGLSFFLTHNPFPGEHIHPGPYRLGRNVEDANIYRVGHPLARRIIETCKTLPAQQAGLAFRYSESGKKISVLEPLVGRMGVLTVEQLTVSTFETEDHLLLAGKADDGEELTPDQCRRLLSLPAELDPAENSHGVRGTSPLAQALHAQEVEILRAMAERDGRFFDLEMSKMDKWAEDVKTGLEMELRELDRDIKARRTEAKKLLLLEEKVKVQRQIKEMEKRRNDLRMNLYKAQDEVDERKEQLIARIEARLRPAVDKTPVFSVKWRVI